VVNVQTFVLFFAGGWFFTRPQETRFRLNMKLTENNSPEAAGPAGRGGGVSFLKPRR
jgi:hypothetical protein